MDRKSSWFVSRRKSLAFWAGSAMVATGVALHLPMFWMGRSTHFRLAGMPMGAGMLAGMMLISTGFALSAYGLLPSGRRRQIGSPAIRPPEDAPLTKAH
jgi:putative MFS transporter